ncbi:hypothetical protein DFJ73DRAFT_775902 [Zopfochytrium polystomum]|nr:hypothetical protein DFJ73DRAFT_775902 [Zopfochytrium polystomum]
MAPLKPLSIGAAPVWLLPATSTATATTAVTRSAAACSLPLHVSPAPSPSQALRQKIDILGPLRLDLRRFLPTSDLFVSPPQYKTLDVPTTADAKTIKKAYLSKVMELHPDRLATRPGGAPKRGTAEHARATSDFMQIVRSFEILSDPDTRRAYDARRSSRGGVGWSGDAAYDTHWASDDPRRSRRQSEWVYRDGRWEQRGGVGGGGGWPGADYDRYYGPMNQGPIYMANGTMAALIIGIAVACSVGLAFLFNERRTRFVSVLNAQDATLQQYYEDRRRKAVKPSDHVGALRAKIKPEVSSDSPEALPKTESS